MKLTASAKLTKDCFKDFSYRDSDFDAWLPKEQPAQTGEVTVIKLEKTMTFLEMAKKYLGSTDVEVIKKHTLTLPMVEEMIDKHESELRTDGWSNFFFLENDNGGVSVGVVSRAWRVWGADVNRLDDGIEWLAGHRLLVRNLTLNPSSLEARVAKLEQFETAIRDALNMLPC